VSFWKDSWLVFSFMSCRREMFIISEGHSASFLHKVLVTGSGGDEDTSALLSKKQNKKKTKNNAKRRQFWLGNKQLTMSFIVWTITTDLKKKFHLIHNIHLVYIKVPYKQNKTKQKKHINHAPGSAIVIRRACNYDYFDNYLVTS